MTPSKKVVLLASLGLSAAGLAYYLLVYRKNQNAVAIAVNTIASGVNAAQASTGGGLTIADLKAKIWRNAPGDSTVARLLTSYDPLTGIVRQQDTNWTGVLVNPTTIAWKKNNGETQNWTALSGLGSISTGYFI